MEYDMEQRIAAIEARQAMLERRMGDLATKLDENSATTQSIKEDTSQMVALFRASMLGASIIKWAATVGGGAIVAYAALKGLAGH